METLQQQKNPQKTSYGSRSSVSNAAIAYPSRTIVHAKLEMTEPGDHDEQEADAVANDIVSGGKIRRKISNGGSSGISVSPQVESQIAQLQGGGHAMPEGLRNMMENGFGRDFSQVRLHTDSQAADMSSSISARAFTHGNDIYFNRGQFSPNTSEGQRLVAHELTHVTQGTGKVGREENEENDMNSLIIKMCNDETSQEKSENYAKEFVKDKKGKGEIASGGSLSMTGDKCNLFVYNVLFRAYLEKTKKEKKDGKTQFDKWHFLKDKGKVAPKTVSNIYKDVVFSDNSILRKIDDIKDVKPGDIVIWTFKEEKNGIIKLPHHIEIVAGISNSGKEKSWSLNSFGAHPNGAYNYKKENNKNREITEVHKSINIKDMYVDKERKKLLPKEKKEEGAKLYSLKEGITEINTKYNCGKEGPIEFYRFEGELTHVAQGTGEVGREDCSIEKEDLCSECPYSDYTVLLDKLKKSGVFDETAQKNLEWIVMYYFQYMHQFEMEDINNIAHFFSQVYGEVSSLSKFEEGFFYSPERLANIFPKIFAEKDTGSPNEKAKELGRRKGEEMSIENQKEIANLVYGGKYGNSHTGDGWKYRGRGLLQITFKDNYKKINDIIAETTGEIFDIVGNPDQIITNDKLKVLTAMAYWKKRQLNTKLKKRK